MSPLVVIGGGPAGMAAAIEASRAGLECTLLDEAPALGGQIYRQLPPQFRARDRASLGKDFERGERLRAEFASAARHVEVLSGASVSGIWGRQIVWSRQDASGVIEAERIVLATGAYDRPVPFPGWTLPGVMTAGGAQALVKTMRVRPGRRALVAGTGPLLLVVAAQLHAADVEVVAVLEAGRPKVSLRAAAKVWRETELLADAARYLWTLRRARIPLLFNHTIFEAHGSAEVDGASYGPVDPETWQPIRDRARRVDVDLVVVGFGFVPNTELSELAGCEHAYVHDVGGWVPERDPETLETSVPGVFAVGDGAGVAGALVAVEEGRVAGIAAAEQAGALSAAEARARRARPLERLRSLSRVREVLDEVSRLRPGLCDLVHQETLACRCEEVRVREVHAALDEGARDLQAIKLLTRLGMGPCQGRNCGPSMAMHCAGVLGCSPAELGRIRPRPPVKPVTVGAFASMRGPADDATPKHGSIG